MQEGEHVGQPNVCLKLHNLYLFLHMCMPIPLLLLFLQRHPEAVHAEENRGIQMSYALGVSRIVQERQHDRLRVSTMTGNVAVITGGTSGIGKATAQLFVRAGAKVVICGRNQDRGQEVISELKAMNGDALFVKADVSKAAEVESLIETTVSTNGRLDYAANIAGIGAYATTVDCTEKLWDLMMRVNVKSMWLSMKYEIPHILKQGGAIVNMSSITGLVGIIGQPAYAASKPAIIGLTKTAALEYAKQGIRINAICPGSILTPMQDPVINGNPEIAARIGARHPIGRMGTAEECAAAIHWLCSDAASFVTGCAMTVDGGYVAQ